VQRSLGIVAVVGMTLIPLLAASQSPSSGVHPREGFAGSLAVLNKGKPEAMAVNYRTWMIPPGATIDDLAGGGGNLVVEVASGALTAIIDGRKQAKQFGEFFAVPAGHKLQIVTTNRSAILHTLQLGQ
jgi:gentisate 1,2-dioxygenase